LIGLSAIYQIDSQLLEENEEGYYVPRKGHKIFVCIHHELTRVAEWHEVMGFYVLSTGAVRVRTSQAGNATFERFERSAGAIHDITNPSELFVATNLKEF